MVSQSVRREHRNPNESLPLILWIRINECRNIAIAQNVICQQTSSVCSNAPDDNRMARNTLLDFVSQLLVHRLALTDVPDQPPLAGYVVREFCSEFCRKLKQAAD